MALFTPGEKKNRPGVHLRTVNRDDTVVALEPTTPWIPSEPETVLLLVDQETLYHVGPALSLNSASETVVVADAVNAAVYGETMVVRNRKS